MLRIASTSRIIATTSAARFANAAWFSTHKLTVSILGPPNAGKSTLFNRLMDKQANGAYKLGSEKNRKSAKKFSKGRLGTKSNARWGGAIVSSTPGTTRDRRECIGRIGATTFRLMDTAGIDGSRIGSNNDEVMQQMMHQSWQAAQAADVILLMLDARLGVTTSVDWMETAQWLRKMTDHNPKVVVLANKLEGDAWDYHGSPVLDNIEEMSRVGFGEPILLSAIHGDGMAELAVVLEELEAEKRERLGMPPKDENEEDEDDLELLGDDKPLQLAILGRQNVGKSTLVNALLEEERVIAGPTPGLTRDAIAIEWEYQGRPVKLVDTAGIRRIKKREDDGMEDLAVQDAMRAMKVADVAVLVLDAGATKLQRQELAIASAVVKEGRAIVVVANKQDLLVTAGYSPKQFRAAVQDHLENRLPMLRKTPVVAMSALKGENVETLLPIVFRARDRWARTVNTGVLNRWLKEVVRYQPPPMHQGRFPTKLKYILQTKGRPPTFMIFCNTTELPVSYTRYLLRNFQDTFEYFGMEVRMLIKKSAPENPYYSGRKRGGSGLGGSEARKKRHLASLKSTGVTKEKRRRKRRR